MSVGGLRRAEMRAAGALALCAATMLLSGCGPARPRKPVAAPKPPQQETTAPREVTANRITLRWQERAPGGHLRRVLEVDAASGQLDAESQSGELQHAQGTAFRDDRPRARFQAPFVQASKDRSTVTARGGVRVQSIEPPGLTVTADRVSWRTDLDRITATGSVRFEHRPPGAPRPVAWGGPFPRMTIYQLKRITIP